MCVLRTPSGMVFAGADSTVQASQKEAYHILIGDIMGKKKWADCLLWVLEDCPCRDCSDYVNEFGETFEDIYVAGTGSHAFGRKGGLTDEEWAAVEKWREVATLPVWVVSEKLAYLDDVYGSESDDWDQVANDEELDNIL